MYITILINLITYTNLSLVEHRSIVPSIVEINTTIGLRTMEKCKKHPKYTGKKLPKKPCIFCLILYTDMRHVRHPVMPTKVVKSKKVYNRKRLKNEDIS